MKWKVGPNLQRLIFDTSSLHDDAEAGERDIEGNSRTRCRLYCCVVSAVTSAGNCQSTCIANNNLADEIAVLAEFSFPLGVRAGTPLQDGLFLY